MDWEVRAWGKKKGYCIGYCKEYNVCTWPPDNYNGTLKKIREDDQWMTKYKDEVKRWFSEVYKV